jgi:hypothetical protein
MNDKLDSFQAAKSETIAGPVLMHSKAFLHNQYTRKSRFHGDVVSDVEAGAHAHPE